MKPESEKFIESLMHWHADERDAGHRVAARFKKEGDLTLETLAKTKAERHQSIAMGLLGVLKREAVE